MNEAMETKLIFQKLQVHLRDYARAVVNLGADFYKLAGDDVSKKYGEKKYDIWKDGIAAYNYFFRNDDAMAFYRMADYFRINVTAIRNEIKRWNKNKAEEALKRLRKRWRN